MDYSALPKNKSLLIIISFYGSEYRYFFFIKASFNSGLKEFFFIDIFYLLR
jgi:hypothetical protein